MIWTILTVVIVSIIFIVGMGFAFFICNTIFESFKGLPTAIKSKDIKKTLRHLAYVTVGSAILLCISWALGAVGIIVYSCFWEIF